MSDDNNVNDDEQEFQQGQEEESGPLFKMSYPDEKETKDKPEKDD